MLAAAGTEVTHLAEDDRIVEALDADVEGYLGSVLSSLGIEVITGAFRLGPDGNAIIRDDAAAEADKADIVVAPDTRRPNLDALDLAAAGV
jgi:pyruvate/2-oxoglutarate dehydrogenase complex dihydrolipoamide dehydrogenase (E3) component